MQVLRLLAVVEAELIEVEAGGRRVQQADDDLLAPHGGQGIDPHVHGSAAGDLQLDPPILGQTPLGDIQPRHHL